MRRCFIAIKIPKKVKKEIQRIQNLLKKKDLFYGKYIENENIHLTLKFIGNIDNQTIDKIKKELGKIRLENFECYLENTGYFSEHFIRVLLIGVSSEDIVELNKKINNRLRKIIDIKNELEFIPHITIARVKKAYEPENLKEHIRDMKINKISFKVDKFFLFESKIDKNNNIIYKILDEFILK